MGTIVACCADASGFFVMVDKPKLMRNLSPHSARWSLTEATREVWDAEEVTRCLAWKVEQNYVVVITM